MSISAQGANLLTAAFTSGGFAAASGNVNYTNANTITYAINGQFYSRASVASQAFTIEPNTGIVPTAPNTFQTVPAGQACAFAVVLDANAAFTVVQGPLVQTTDKTPVPAVPSGKAIVGVIKVVNATVTANGGFRVGTDALNTAGLTTTYVNLSQHPGSAI